MVGALICREWKVVDCFWLWPHLKQPRRSVYMFRNECTHHVDDVACHVMR